MGNDDTEKGRMRMTQSEFTNIRIAGIMTAVPKTTEDILEKYSPIFGEDVVRSFSKNTGVRKRRVANEQQTASDLAYVAADELLKKKRIERDKVGVVIFVSQCPDYIVPATACVLHKRLGLKKDCMAFDVNMGCSGYVYGLQIICSLMSSMNVEYGLLLVGDTSNRDISPEDKSAAMLFGEAGSATLLERKEDVPAVKTLCRTDGNGFKAIIIPGGGFRNPKASTKREVWGDGNVRSDCDLYMDGVEVFSFSISEVPEMINYFFDLYDTNSDKYDAYVFHQANCYILKQIMKRCKLPKDKVLISMENYGNTSVASIPLTICDGYGETQDRKDVNMLMCGFGIGLSWGCVDMVINTSDIFPIIETDDYYTEGEVSHD